MLTQASLPPKAAKTSKDKVASALARLPVRETSLPLLAGSGGGRRLALAGRWLATRCVLADKQGGRGGAVCLVAGAGLVSTPHLTGSGRLLMARKRLLLPLCGGHVVRRGSLR
jgi:hypothetical protein